MRTVLRTRSMPQVLWMAMNLLVALGLSGCLARANAAEGVTKGPSPSSSPQDSTIPPSWEVMPIPRWVDYGLPTDFVALGRVAIVRRNNSPYQTRRDAQKELAGGSTITEEELTAILNENGLAPVTSLADDLASYEGYDTLIVLGAPRHNTLSARLFDSLKLSFARWDDPLTPEKDFNAWPDFGREGYLLKVGRLEKQNVILLAGYDYDDVTRQFCGAGTFYAMQSLRQLIVNEGGTLKVKTAEIADKPLMAIHGAYSGFAGEEEQELRNIAFMPRVKFNQNVWWYGNGLAGYNVEATVKFRYPWRPEQLATFAKIGKYCREHFVTMIFCMNPDHYGVEWAAPKTFDGKKKDPFHYDPNYRVEPQYKEIWAKLGVEVHSDIDILVAKFGQISKAVPGAVFQMMNEDDGFGLIHESDKKLYNHTGDVRQDAIKYGRARAEALIAVYKGLRKNYPSSGDLLPFDPPGSLVYQLVLDSNAANSREFMQSMSATIQASGLRDKLPVITTGGGTAAEVVTNRKIDDFKQWAGGAPIVICDNNFPQGFHSGAYETDPKGPRFPPQIHKDYPAGYRDRELYKRLLGVHWNGLNDQQVQAWCQSQYMWNMLALDRKKANAMAVRKVSSAASYPLIRSFFEEFDQPVCYLPDNQPPYRILVVGKMYFPGKGNFGWEYEIKYTDAYRRESQRLREKLGRLMPALEAQWENKVERDAELKNLGARAYAFCSVYLANGYLKGWKDAGAAGKLEGNALRDLYLEAEDIQQRFFAGPEACVGKVFVDNSYYSAALKYLYTKGAFGQPPKTVAEATSYVDIWKEGLKDKFFVPVSAVALADLKDSDAMLKRGWGKAGETDKEKYRPVAGEAILAMTPPPAKGRLLVRVRIGTAAATRAESTEISLAAAGAEHRDAVCMPRWIYWLLPDDATLGDLAIKAKGPVRVYAAELFRTRSDNRMAFAR